MSGFVRHDLQIAQPSGWLDQLKRLLARELAPNPRKFRTALRIATIATIGAGLIASCHVNSQYGTYFVWLLAGAGPMLSVRKALLFLVAEAFALAASVVMAFSGLLPVSVPCLCDQAIDACRCVQGVRSFPRSANRARHYQKPNKRRLEAHQAAYVSSRSPSNSTPQSRPR
jgi:hypothetical protein